MLAHRTFTVSAESVSPANNAIRADKAFADVLLLVGPAKTPVYAHAAILAANCAYYKQALSVRWKSPVPKKGLDIDPAVKLRAVLTHPDIELQVMNIILEFIYTGTTEVPAILAEETALFADQILLESLKDQCLSYFTRNCISPVNAFDAFTLCGRLNYIKGQGTALVLASIDLSTAISSGMQCLKEMSPDIMAETLSFHEFDAKQRWELLISWLKARQGFDDLSVTGGVVGWDMTWVQAETEHLIPIVGLFDLKKELYNTLVEPYLGIFEDGLRGVIYRHFVPSKSVFQHEQTPILSSLDSQRVFNAIFRSFRKPLLTPPRSPPSDEYQFLIVQIPKHVQWKEKHCIYTQNKMRQNIWRLYWW